jgi:hypothetical protein
MAVAPGTRLGPYEIESNIGAGGPALAEPPALTTLQPLTPPGVDRLAKWCLAKGSDDRWDSAHDVE